MASAARLEKLNERPGLVAAGDLFAAAEAVGSRHLTAVQRDHVELRAEAASGYGRAFTVAAVDRHASDALESFRQVRVRELADVFRVDRVDHAERVTLRLHGSFQASAQTCDHHFFEFFTRLLLGEHRIDKHCATNNGEQRLGR